MLVYWDKKKQF